MIMSCPLSAPTNLKFKPIFPILNVEAQAHLESNVSQLVKEPLSLSLVMKNKKQNHEGVWHFKNKWAMCLPWEKSIADCKSNVH